MKYGFDVCLLLCFGSGKNILADAIRYEPTRMYRNLRNGVAV